MSKTKDQLINKMNEGNDPDKEYELEIVLKFTQIIRATSKEEAKERVEATFYEEYAIDLAETEIKSIKEI